MTIVDTKVAARSISRVGPEVAGLWERFPPRPVPATWATTEQSRQQVLDQLLAPPFVLDNPSLQAGRRVGLVKVLHWLAEHPGDTWQDRWIASGADAAGNTAWRQLIGAWLHRTGWGYQNLRGGFIAVGRGLLPLISGDVIRPSLGWLLTPGTPKNLTEEMARARDPQGFAELATLTAADPANAGTKQTALRRIAAMMAAKGGVASEVTVGDCLELLGVLGVGDSRKDTSLYFYQLLHAAGIFAPSAPPTVRVFNALGQESVEQLIDRYDIACRPIRNLLVAYLRERRPTMDYTSLRNLAVCLGKLFWKDLEVHHPGIDSLRLASDVAAAWKQRVATKQTRTGNGTERAAEARALRSDHGINYLAMVRAFYLDIAQWAMEDPPQWGPWAAPCPIRDEEMSFKKVRSHRKARIDARTRERIPVLPVLVNTADSERKATVERLQAARLASPGEVFTAGGRTLRRSEMSSKTRKAAAKTWADDPDTGQRRDLTLEEHRAFWTWAAVEVLRSTGIRIEELTELSHHSLAQYRLPTTGELVPLLQIAPSKTDAERLLIISPELADVLSAIICRIRDPSGAVPLVVSYDIHERVWNPPMPLLFQRRFGAENRPIPAGGIRALLNEALTGTGLTDASGRPLTFSPHDFRRLFITDAVLNGMPPHIAQLVCGHRDINTTMGYKAVYPEEVINGHRAFIARRRAARPSEEYRTPTDEEWEEFLGHFERRKVAFGVCGRSFGTRCIHEHACVRCSLLRPDPAQRDRLAEVRDNLRARIDEARREGWLGEVEGLKVSLAGAKQKLAQANELAARQSTVRLGMPGFSHIAGRATTGKAPS
jgi:integrase